MDKDGLWPFSISFEGNDTIEAGSAEILIRESTLDMELADIDSIKTVNLHAEKLVNGKMVPVAGEMLTVYVPRSSACFLSGKLLLMMQVLALWNSRQIFRGIRMVILQ